MGRRTYIGAYGMEAAEELMKKRKKKKGAFRFANVQKTEKDWETELSEEEEEKQQRKFYEKQAKLQAEEEAKRNTIPEL